MIDLGAALRYSNRLGKHYAEDDFGSRPRCKKCDLVLHMRDLCARHSENTRAGSACARYGAMLVINTSGL